MTPSPPSYLEDQNFIIAGLDLLGAKLAPKNRSYTDEELEYANELQTLIDRVTRLFD